MEYIQKNIRITASEVNNVLALTGFSVDQSTLDLVLSKNPLSFSNLDENIIFSELWLDKIGTVRNEKSKGGVYIWIHKATGDKYVGSSRRSRDPVGYLRVPSGEVLL